MVRIDVKFYREVGFTEEEISKIKEIIEQAPLEASLEAVMSAEIVFILS